VDSGMQGLCNVLCYLPTDLPKGHNSACCHQPPHSGLGHCGGGKCGSATLRVGNVAERRLGRPLAEEAGLVAECSDGSGDSVESRIAHVPGGCCPALWGQESQPRGGKNQIMGQTRLAVGAALTLPDRLLTLPNRSLTCSEY